MDVDSLPQIIDGKPPLNGPNGYPWAPTRPMDVHPFPHLGLWISMDEYGEFYPLHSPGSSVTGPTKHRG